jgi:DNA mismatch endonuclease (patch repair protein)
VAGLTRFLRMDVLTPEQRRRCMSAVRGKDTAPELRLRRALHALGYRYHLHASTLPGKPDIVFPVRKKLIFVHGCFWHRHNCKSGRSSPSVRISFWSSKLQANVQRDQGNIRRLRNLGWKVLVAWECQLAPNRIDKSLDRVRAFLER